MRKMRFGLNLLQDRPLGEVVEWWRTCDTEGIDLIGVPDSPALVRELYVSWTCCAINTSRAQVVAFVTNPLTRHPSVTAGGLISLDELAPGRIALGIGTGDSALWAVQMKPASVALLREYIVAVKGLVRGDEVEYQGRRLKAEWMHWSPPSQIPIYVACAGPKVLKMASQVADGVIIAMGYARETLEYVRRIIKDACEEVNRAPDDLEVWWNARVVFGSSSEAARTASIGMNVSWMTMGSLEGKLIPDEYKAPLLELTRGMHDLRTAYHDPGRERNVLERAKQLGIYEWLVSLSPRLSGTAAEVSGRLAELRELGLCNWIFYVDGPDLDRIKFIHELTRSVIPRLMRHNEKSRQCG